MTLERALDIIKNGESKTVEFKSCKKGLTIDIYATICAFANTDGGHLF